MGNWLQNRKPRRKNEKRRSINKTNKERRTKTNETKKTMLGKN